MNEVSVSKRPRFSVGWFLTFVLAVHCSMAVGQGAQFSIQSDLQATSTAGSQTPETGSITFTNSGNAVVNVTLFESNATCTAVNDAAWLSLSSNTVSVPPSSTQKVTVTFDASGLFQETYMATICAATGTSLGNVLLPVTFTIDGAFPSPLIVYDDTSRNGFDPVNCTANGPNATVNFDSSNRVHSGVAAISASGTGQIFVGWCAPNFLYAPYDVSAVNFWIYVSEDISNSWTLEVRGITQELSGEVKYATLAELYGMSVPDHQWVNINVSLRDPVFHSLFGGAIDQIIEVDFTTASNDGVGVLYIDDVSFTGETIFYGGFEP